MQNNDLFYDMFNEITKAHYILLVTDKNPNSDSITSGLALSNYFFENKIKHKVFNLSSKLPRKLNFLSKYDKITKDIPKFYDLVIYLGCNDKDVVLQECQNEVNTISIASSKRNTSELLYEFFKINQLKISKNTAECLYVGIYNESLGFTTTRTDSETFTIVSDLLNSNINVSEISDNLSKRESLAKFKIISKVMNTLELFREGKLATVYLDDIWIKETGAEVSECDDIVDTVLNIGIVQIVVYFRIIENQVRVSLKSKGAIDVCLLANKFNGGGYKNSAELSIPSSSVIEVKEEVVKTILNYI